MNDNPERIILKNPKIEIDIVRINKVDNLCEYYQVPQIRRVFTKFKYFIRQGVVIYLAIHNNNVVGHYLITKLVNFKPYLYNNHQIFSKPPNKNIYYIFYCNTFKKYRGNGIYPYMLAKMSEDVFQGDKNAVVYISTEITNIPSQKGIEKVGFKKVARLKYLQIGLITKKEVENV